MLYKVGTMIVLLSCVFCGGSFLIPVTMATVGVVLMRLGRRIENGK